MFHKGERWRHQNCIDVDIIVEKVVYRGPNYWKLKVFYWNRHYKDIILPTTDLVKIKCEDLSKWKLMESV